MALDITATQSVYTNTIAITGAATSDTIKLFRTTDSSLLSDIASAVDNDSMTLLVQKTGASWSYTDNSQELAGGETYYYIAYKDDDTTDYASVTMTQPSATLCATDMGALLVSAQLNASMQTFRSSLDRRYIYLLVLESDASVEDSAITALASTGQTIKKIGTADVTTVTGYEPALVGSAVVRYFHE